MAYNETFYNAEIAWIVREDGIYSSQLPMIHFIMVRKELHKEMEMTSAEEMEGYAPLVRKFGQRNESFLVTVPKCGIFSIRMRITSSNNTKIMDKSIKTRN